MQKVSVVLEQCENLAFVCGQISKSGYFLGLERIERWWSV
jgi:hypothetical protein